MSKAILKYYRAKPRKTRQIADMIRGKRVADALNLLRLSTRSSAKVVEKVLLSALANATDKGEHDDPEGLIVKSIRVDGGPTLKRFRARARGRIGRVKHRSCHIRVDIGEAS